MAQGLLLKNGSPLIGSPIIYQVQAAVLKGTVSFHRLNLTVKAALDGTDSSYTELTLSSPADSGEILKFDISSALRAVADKYEYTVNPPTAYPTISYSLSACDEYMQNGEVVEDVGVVTATGGKVIMGAYSDLERILSGGSKQAQHFTRKPKTLPEVVAAGETMVCPQSFSSAVTEGNVTTGPTSSVVSITTEGLQTINGRSVFALPSRQPDRYEFRFVNGLGCLESVSLRSLRTTEMNLTVDSYIRSIQEDFASFSRGLVNKQNDYETWSLSTGPLDEAWQSWYMHEFLMAKYVWIKVSGNWLPCHIEAEDTVTGIDRTDAKLMELVFSVRLDLNGSPLAALAI